MSNTHRYPLKEDDIALIDRLVKVVRKDPGRFHEAGTALDQHYSAEQVTKRCYARYQDVALAHYESIDEAKKDNHLGDFEAPEVSLVARFKHAWSETFSLRARDQRLPYWVMDRNASDHRYRSALHLLALKDQEEVAARRVLMTWLRFDADRGSVEPQVSEFQELRTVPTPEGDPPLVVPTGDPHDIGDKTLYVAEDGSWETEEAGWFRLAREAEQHIGVADSPSKKFSGIDPTMQGEWFGPASKCAVARVLYAHKNARARQINHIWKTEAQIVKVTGGYAFKFGDSDVLKKAEWDRLRDKFPLYKAVEKTSQNQA